LFIVNNFSCKNVGKMIFYVLSLLPGLEEKLHLR